MITFDGQAYKDASEIPDLGSLVCIAVDGDMREYRGLSSDFGKLPTYDNLGTGSSCLFPDTGEYAEYIAYNKTWYLV